MRLLEALGLGRLAKDSAAAPDLDQTTFGTGTLGPGSESPTPGDDTATGAAAKLSGDWHPKPPGVPRPNRKAVFALFVVVILIVWAVAFSAVGGARRAREPKAPVYAGKAPTKDQIASEIAALEEERRRSERLEQLRHRTPGSLQPQAPRVAGAATEGASGSSNPDQLARELEARMQRRYGSAEPAGALGSGYGSVGGAMARSPEERARQAEPLAPGWGERGRFGARAPETAARVDPTLAGLPPELAQLYEASMRNLGGAAGGAYEAQLAGLPDGVDGAVSSGSAGSGAAGAPAPSIEPGFLARHGAGYLTGTVAAPVLESTLGVPRTRYLITQGTLLPAVLETQLDSELPGQARALLRSNVYDSNTGTHLLLPQGSRLLGEYASRVAYGQRRLFLSWNRVLLPDGRTLQLGGLPGADLLGASGFADQVDRHFLRVFGTALLLSVVSAGYEVSQGDSPSGRGLGDSSLTPAEITRQAVASEFNRAAQRMLERELDVAPTLRIRSGYPFTIQVVADIVLPGAWKDSRGDALVALPH